MVWFLCPKMSFLCCHGNVLCCLQEVAAAERVRRSAEAEKDELHDEVSTSGSKL